MRAELGTMSEVWLVECDDSRLALRGHRAQDWWRVEFEHLVMATARRASIPAPLALRSLDNQVAVRDSGRWWSLLVWIDGHQPERGSHSDSQAESMGQMLSRIHSALAAVPRGPDPSPDLEPTTETIRRIEQLLARVGEVARPGRDEESAQRWLTGQHAWLTSHLSDQRPASVSSQVIHGDYHDANLVFSGNSVAGVLDWERARPGCPVEEVIRAMHLSFRLDHGRSKVFLDGYRSERSLTKAELDAAAWSYGYHRDRSVWFFDELYRRGNDRLRPLLNHGPFIPFWEAWTELRDSL